MINIAVVGCGHWGPNHIRVFGSLPECRVSMAVDSDRRRLQAVRGLYPSVRLESDAARAFTDPRVDAVVIATPTSTHFELVRRALAAGKHVLCEKPLCRRASEARELATLARRHRRILMTGHVFLFNSGIVKLKELYDSKELGEFRYLSAVRTNLGPIRGDINVAFDLATHDISVANWLIGDAPQSVSAVGGTFLQSGIEDVVFATLRYKRNGIAHIHASWLNPKKVRQLTLVGSRKMATWDDLELSAPVAIFDCGANAVLPSRGGKRAAHRGASTVPIFREYGEFLRISMWDADVRLPKIRAEEPLKAQNRHFLTAVAGGKLDRSDAVFTLGVVRTLEAIETSLERGGASVRLRA